MSFSRLTILGLLGLAAGCTSALPRVPPFFEPTTSGALVGTTMCGTFLQPSAEFPCDEIPGVERGDLLVAVDGYRVYDGREFQLFRRQRGPEADALTLLVERNGDIRRIDVANTPALRRIGQDMRTNGPTLPALLQQMGVPCGDEERRILIRFPQRAVQEIMDWLAADPGHVRQVDWLRDLTSLYIHLANQEWEQAATLDAKPSPLPYCRRLACFYQSLAERNRHGEQPPDPAAHGESLEFYVINYPYPKFIWPAKGVLTSTDTEFLLYLDRRYQEPFGPGGPAAHWAMEQLEKYERGSERQCYMKELKAALVCPNYHGGWPYRTSFVQNAETRKPLVSKLRDGLAKKDADQLLYGYSLVGPLVIDNQEAELLARLEALGQQSPYFCLLATDTALNAAQSCRNQPLKEHLLEWWARKQPAGLPPGPPSAWLAYVKARSRHFSPLTEFGTEQEALQALGEAAYAQPFATWCALRRPLPLAETERALDQALAAPDWVAHRRELLRQIVAVATPDVIQNDSVRMEQLIRDQAGYGLYLEGMSALLFWGSQPPRFEGWMFNSSNILTFDPNDQAYSAMREAVGRLDWTSPTLDTQARELFERLGRPAAALLLADALDAHGRAEPAARIRGEVVRYYRRLTEYHRAAAYGKDGEFSLLRATVALASSPATSGQTLEYGQRFLAVSSPQQRQDQVYLDLAQAALQLGRLPEATTYLIESFNCQTVDDAVYYYDGRMGHSAEAFRAWLWRRLTTHQAFTPELRQKLETALPLARRQALSAPNLTR